MEEFGGVGDGAEVAPPPGKPGIAPRLFAGPDAGLSLRMVAVVMILVDCHHRARSIDHRLPRIQCLPHQPVVPEDAQDERRHIRSVRARQYWRLEKLKSFDEFLEKRFPESRRKAYYLMAIRENLPRVPKPELREVGWSKAVELVRIAKRDRETFDCATWLHKAKELPKEGFKIEVGRYLSGKETDAGELVYFKFYTSQLAVSAKAIA